MAAAPDHSPESDWKVLRELREVALERFCERTLEEVQRILRKASQSHHERYLEVYRFLRTRDRDLARMFDNPRRSHMMGQLIAIVAYGLVEPEELRRFTERTRATAEALAKEFSE